MKILLVDDHPLFRSGLAHLLYELDSDVVVLEAGSCAEAMQLLLQAEEPDLILLDVNLPDSGGLACLTRFKQSHPTVPVVILSALETAEVMRNAMAAGASGYIPKSSTGGVMVQALRLVLLGGTYLPHRSEAALAGDSKGLTPRQREVLQLLVQGLSNKAIAQALGMAEGTVRVHMTALIRQLGASNRTEAAMKAVQFGLVET